MQLMLWVRTRWASLYDFLNRILLMRKVHRVQITGFCDLILSNRPSTILPNWQMRVTKFLTWKRKIIQTFIFVNGTGKSSRSCTRFSRYATSQWPLTVIFFSPFWFQFFFKEPASAKQTFSSSKEPSAFRTIPVLEFLKETWGNMANHPKFSEVENSIHKGIENLDKWYNKVNDTDAYFICLHMYPSNFMIFIQLPNQMISPTLFHSSQSQCEKCICTWQVGCWILYSRYDSTRESSALPFYCGWPWLGRTDFLHTSLILTILHLPKKSQLPSLQLAM